MPSRTSPRHMMRRSPRPSPPDGGSPRRTCVGCRAARDQDGLVRIVADAAGGVAVNPTCVVGRSAYLCPSLACLEQALRRKVLPRALRVELPALDAEALRRLFAAEAAPRRRASSDENVGGL